MIGAVPRIGRSIGSRRGAPANFRNDLVKGFVRSMMHDFAKGNLRRSRSRKRRATINPPRSPIPPRVAPRAINDFPGATTSPSIKKEIERKIDLMPDRPARELYARPAGVQRSHLEPMIDHGKSLRMEIDGRDTDRARHARHVLQLLKKRCFPMQATRPGAV